MQVARSKISAHGPARVDMFTTKRKNASVRAAISCDSHVPCMVLGEKKSALFPVIDKNAGAYLLHLLSPLVSSLWSGRQSKLLFGISSNCSPAVQISESDKESNMRNPFIILNILRDDLKNSRLG
jgi:hypothetical protein